MKLFLSHRLITSLFFMLVLLSTIHQSKAQEIPFNYLQTVTNTALVNPAAIGADQQSVLSLNYHRQLIGTNDLVPQYSTLVFQTPLGMSRSNIGATLYNYSRSYFNTNGFWISFAHVVPIRSTQLLRFGISGGGNYSRLDVNIVDPVLDNYNQKFSADAQFGVLYENNGFQIGGALTNLLGNALNNDSIFKNNFYSGYYLHSSYQFSITADIQLKPFAAYRSYQTNQNTVASAEGSIQLLYKNLLGGGVGWREKSGPFALASFNLKKITVGAVYKIASGKDNAGNGAFEVQMKIFLGKKRNGIAKKKEDDPVEEDYVKLDESTIVPVDSSSVLKSADSKTKVKELSTPKSLTPANETIVENTTSIPALIKEPSNDDVSKKSRRDSIDSSVKDKEAGSKVNLISADNKGVQSVAQTPSTMPKLKEEVELREPINSVNPLTQSAAQKEKELRKNSKSEILNKETLAKGRDTKYEEELNANVANVPVTSTPANIPLGIESDEGVVKSALPNDKRNIIIDRPDNENGEERLISRPNSGENEIKPGNYVIVQAFRVYDNAMRYVGNLKSQGLAIQCKFSSTSLFYYVFFIESKNVDEARAERDLLRKQNQFKDAWLLQVQ